MANYVKYERSNEVNDIFLLSNGEYVYFPRTMGMTEEDVEVWHSKN